jgi:hypothetical protein
MQIEQILDLVRKGDLPKLNIVFDLDNTILYSLNKTYLNDKEDAVTTIEMIKKNWIKPLNFKTVKTVKIPVSIYSFLGLS